MPTTLTMPSRTAGARIVGTGSAQPSGIMTGAALMAPFGKTAEWLLERTGIRQVRRMERGEDLLDLTAGAAQAALADANIPVEDVDTIIVATCSGGNPNGPTLAARLAERIGAKASTTDVNAVCAGFCFALSTASALVETGAARTVLVVGADQMSSLLDPADMGTSILFGDGAGAMVVTATADHGFGIGPAAWSSDGSKRDLLSVPDGDRWMRMAGQQVFRWAVDEVHKVASKAIASAGLRNNDIDVFVPHQANLRIIDAIKRQLKIGNATTATDIVESGNTSAASIPIALAKLRQSGQTRGGQRALLTGFGAGLSIAAQVVVLP